MKTLRIDVDQYMKLIADLPSMAHHKHSKAVIDAIDQWIMTTYSLSSFRRNVPGCYELTFADDADYVEFALRWL